MDDRERHLLDLVEEVRTDFNARLDALAVAIRGDGQMGQVLEKKDPPKKRRAPLRPPLGGAVLLTDDVVKAKARAALERMGLRRVKG